MHRVTLSLCGVVLLFGYLSCGSKCPGQEPITRHVLCYYEGRTSLNNINLCNCTHIILTDAVTITDDYTLVASEDAETYLESVKEQKESLIKIFTLEAKSNLKKDIFESENKTQELVDGITNFIYESEFDGLELYFPLSVKDDLSRESVMGFVKALKKNLENESHFREKREGYDVFEKVRDDITTAPYRTNASKPAPNNGKSNKKLPVKKRKTHGVLRSGKGSTDEGNTAGEGDNADKERQRKEFPDENEYDAESADSETLLLVRLPVNSEVIAKKFDLKLLSKYANLLVVSTHNLTDESETHLTYHPSRLMGLADMLNADSILDFLTGLGVPKSRIVLTIPATVLKFQLEDANKTTPRSPTVGDVQITDQAQVSGKTLLLSGTAPENLKPEVSLIAALRTCSQLCQLLGRGNWIIERDEDLTAPYAFSNSTWLAYEDELSVKIKAKYIILRDLVGGAIYPIDADTSGGPCKDTSEETNTLTDTLYYNMKNLARKPRALVLDSLRQDIHDTSFSSLQAGVHLSEYRIVRVVDHSGAVHVVRKNTKTEFECSRQGYFSHPLGCNKFYRCVKFNQYSDEFTVFEYDCPAGLAFDERWEVCVWPGSLPHGAPCTGSSEIAPVPRSHYECPREEGYYADPENCRWFFACLDHARDGTSPLTAYEFRCPFGLVFNEEILACDWPWNVGSCGNRGSSAVIFEHHGGSRSAFQSAAYVEDGSRSRDFTDSDRKNFFGGFAGNVINGDAVYLSGDGRSHSSGAAYIAGKFDDYQQRPSFGTLPEHEISGGRILNAGGFVLNQHGNSRVESASAAKFHSINGQNDGYSSYNGFRFTHSSSNTQENFKLHENVGNAVTQTQSSVTQFPANTAEPKLSHLVYDPPLSTPRSFSVGIPEVRINQEPISVYSSANVGSSAAAGIEGKYLANGVGPLTEGTRVPSPNPELGRKINEVFAANLHSDFRHGTFNVQNVVNEHQQNLNNIYVKSEASIATPAEGVKFVSSSRDTAELKFPSPALTSTNYEEDISATLDGKTEGRIYSKPAAFPKVHQINDVFSVSTATPSSSIYVRQDYASNRVLTGHVSEEQSNDGVFFNPQPQFHSLHQSNVAHKSIAGGFPVDFSKTKTNFAVPTLETSELHLKTSHQQPLVDAGSAYRVQEYNTHNFDFPPGIAAHKSLVAEQTLSEADGKSSGGNNIEFNSNYVYLKPNVAFSAESQKIFLPQTSQGLAHSRYGNSDRHDFKQTTSSTFPTATPVILREQDPKPNVFVSTVKPTFFETVVNATSVPISVAFKKSNFAPAPISSPAPFSLRKEIIKSSTPVSIFKGPEYLPPARGTSVEQFHRGKAEGDLITVNPVINQNSFARQTFVTSLAPQTFKPPEYVTPFTGAALKQSNHGKISQTNVLETEFVNHPTETTPIPHVFKASGYLSPADDVLLKEERPEVFTVTKSSVNHNDFVQQTVVTTPSPNAFKVPEYLPPISQVDFNKGRVVSEITPAHQQYVSNQSAEKTTLLQSVASEDQNIQDQHQLFISQPVGQGIDLPERHDQTLNFVPSTKVGPVSFTFEERQRAKAVPQPQTPTFYKEKDTGTAYNFGVSTSEPKPVFHSKLFAQVTTPSSYTDFGLKSIPSSTAEILPYQQSTVSPAIIPAPERHFVGHKEIPSSSPRSEIHQINTFVTHTTSKPSLVIDQPAVKQELLTKQTEDRSSQQHHVLQQYVQVGSSKLNVEKDRNYLPPLEVDKTSQTIFFKQPIVVPETPKENILQQILLQPEVNVHSEREQATLDLGRSKKPKTIYFENYVSKNPLPSLLAHEVVQPVVQQQTYVTTESPVAIANLGFSNEYHREGEDSLTYSNFEFQKIGKVEAPSGFSLPNSASLSAVNAEAGPYRSEKQYVKSLNFDHPRVGCKVDSNIEISPPPKEYFLEVTPNGHSTTAAPELSSITTTTYKTWNRPMTSSEKYVYSSTAETDDSDYYNQHQRSEKGKITVFSIGEVGKEELDDENVESLLQKYSGEFGNVLGGGRNKFATKIVQGEAKGQILVGNEKGSSTVGYEVSSFRSKNRDHSKNSYRSEEEGNRSDKDSVATLDLKNLKIKKNKKTVIVVSQISDSNPLLIGKLAGQCNCQSNNIRIRGSGRRPNKQREHSNAHLTIENGGDITSSHYDDSLAIEAVTPVSSTISLSTENVVLIDGSRATGNSHPTTKEPPLSTAASADPLKSGRVLFKQEESRTRRPNARGKPRSKYNDEKSGNDLGSPLFEPVAAHDIASTVDYASLNPEDRSVPKPSRVTAGAAYDRYGPGGLRGYDETLQGSIDCERPGLFRHPKHCNKFYACNYDPWKKRYVLHVFNCPIHLSYDSSISACNWPSKGPACADDNLLLQ